MVPDGKIGLGGWATITYFCNMDPKAIYFDNNATTPTDPRVLEAMLPYFYEKPGNSASRSHPFGWMAEEAVDQARQQIASLIGVEAKEIVFTSGATESDNLAIKGVFETYYRKGRHIITVKTEHKAVLDSCQRIEKMGGEVTYLDVNENGLINLAQLDASIRPDTVLVSIMWANNETGLIQPMEAIGAICEKHGVILMSDATQAVGKIRVKPKEAGVHLLAFSAHKMYGPKGVGALYVCNRKPRIKLSAQIDGGGHEQGMRSGTLNVPAIVGFGKAAEIASAEMEKDAQRLALLRNKLEKALTKQLEEVYINAGSGNRLAHVSNLSFLHVDAESLLMGFNQYIALSTGSACTSATLEPSHVLLALGKSRELAKSSIRFSLGRFNTEAEVEQCIEAIVQGVERLRAQSPVWEMFKEGRI